MVAIMVEPIKLRIFICPICGHIIARPTVFIANATVGLLQFPVPYMHCGYNMVEYDIEATPLVEPLFKAIDENSTSDTDNTMQQKYTNDYVHMGE